LKQSAKKIYTEVLENETRMLNRHRELLKANGDMVISETQFKKLYFNNFSTISLSTYNKYLKELKDGTYIRCEARSI